MKIFITNRNYLTWPRSMAEKLSGEGHEVVFIDNVSTYQPLLDWYDSCEFEVIRLKENHGNVAAWSQNIVTELNEPYVVTDPDYDLSAVPSDWAEVLLEGFREHPQFHKYCLSWDEALVPPENPAWTMDEMYKYPQGHPAAWGSPIGGNWYNTPSDTSFAVHKPHVPFYIGGIRKGRPYTGTHLPWHLVLEESKDSSKRSVIFSDEHEYYFDHCENSSFTWARMLSSGMLAEYKKRKLNGTQNFSQ